MLNAQRGAIGHRAGRLYFAVPERVKETRMQRRDAIKVGLLGVAAFSTRAFGQAASTDRVLPGDGAVAIALLDCILDCIQSPDSCPETIRQRMS